MTTVTTVGYGDISPDTEGDRVLAITIMAVGIGFVALLTAFVAERFLREEEELTEHERQVLNELRQMNERLDRLERRG